MYHKEVLFVLPLAALCLSNNSGCKHGKHEKNWYNSLGVMSNVKVFAMHNGGQLAGWPPEQTGPIT